MKSAAVAEWGEWGKAAAAADAGGVVSADIIADIYSIPIGLRQYTAANRLPYAFLKDRGIQFLDSMGNLSLYCAIRSTKPNPIMRVPLALLLSLSLVFSAFANPNNLGQSGAPGLQACAASCHGSGAGSVTVTGFPSIYMPYDTYLLTVQKLSGFSIKNFHSSIRIGWGTRMAGTLAPGFNTALYSVPSESSGVHLATLDHDSATFYWTAPGPVGPVSLYLAAHQGPRNEGPNTTIVLISNMAYPDTARNPRPQNGSQDVLTTANLYWSPGVGSETHDVYFGTDPNPPFIGNQTDSIFDPPGEMEYATTYYWKVDERNNAGMAPGPVWSFFTHILAADDWPAGVPRELALGPAYPNPFNATLSIPFALPKAAEVRLELFDITGRQRAVLAEGMYTAGTHRVQWNAEAVGSGVYLVRLIAGDRSVTTKVVAMK